MLAMLQLADAQTPLRFLLRSARQTKSKRGSARSASTFHQPCSAAPTRWSN